MFLEGQDDSLLHYDGGEFYQWLQDCKAGMCAAALHFTCGPVTSTGPLHRPKWRLQAPAGPGWLCSAHTAMPGLRRQLQTHPSCPLRWPPAAPAGRADPAEGFPFPLVVLDRDLRTVLEIKPPSEQQQADGDLRQAAAAAAAPAAARSAAAGDGIIVPVVRELPLAEQPDSLVRSAGPPVVQRMQMQPAEQPDVAGTSAAAQAASAAWRSAERAVALDPPYIRYVQVWAGAGSVGWVL